ncbi:MAG: M18 family aminopeptidase [Clostridia bacterium]|nr:M18 family aminopeptidase [Clostridia bacterium]
METNEKLLEFINSSVTPFHCVDTVAGILDENGFTRLSESGDFVLEKGGKYYVARNESSLIAFTVPCEQPSGFMIGAAHTDSPSFRIKDVPTTFSTGYVKVNTEGYGGMLCATWLDRPLSAAGRVTFRKDRKLFTINIDLKKPLFIIPSVAIHMDRNANSGANYNMAQDMQAVFSLNEKSDLKKLVADAAGCAPDDVVGTDLMLYQNGGVVWGAENEFVSSPRLDDLQSLFALTEGFVGANNGRAVPVLYVADNEEVGSSTKQGAGSAMLGDVLFRICESLGMNRSGYLRMLAGSFLVSADNAHAVHPNHPEYADRSNHPKLNEGIVIKFNSNQRYCTDSVSAGVFREICSRAGVPTQVFANRSDIPGGSTLGNIAVTKTPVSAVDVGLPQLAMHSSFETAGAKDTEYLIKAMQIFFSSSITSESDGTVSIN